MHCDRYDHRPGWILGPRIRIRELAHVSYPSGIEFLGVAVEGDVGKVGRVPAGGGLAPGFHVLSAHRVNVDPNPHCRKRVADQDSGSSVGTRMRCPDIANGQQSDAGARSSQIPTGPASNQHDGSSQSRRSGRMFVLESTSGMVPICRPTVQEAIISSIWGPTRPSNPSTLALVAGTPDAGPASTWLLCNI